jgi:hypothetical protein
LPQQLELAAMREAEIDSEACEKKASSQREMDDQDRHADLNTVPCPKQRRLPRWLLVLMHEADRYFCCCGGFAGLFGDWLPVA